MATQNNPNEADTRSTEDVPSYFQVVNELAAQIRSLPAEWVVHLHHLLVEDDWLTDYTDGLLTMVHWDELNFQPGVEDPYFKPHPDRFVRRAIMKELGHQHWFFRVHFAGMLNSGIASEVEHKEALKGLQPKKTGKAAKGRIMAKLIDRHDAGLRGDELLQEARRLHAAEGLKCDYDSGRTLEGTIRKCKSLKNTKGETSRGCPTNEADRINEARYLNAARLGPDQADDVDDSWDYPDTSDEMGY